MLRYVITLYSISKLLLLVRALYALHIKDGATTRYLVAAPQKSVIEARRFSVQGARRLSGLSGFTGNGQHVHNIKFLYDDNRSFKLHYSLTSFHKNYIRTM